ncbi:MAG: TetR/AcrR family transcriptional regulator [Sedimentitalea sp.]|uniref:TetR/AcrR family transcriptional regulator n=1 Tax=Sedimentitalea sp. TaxID=2048915 RepID=UPI003265CB22
MPRTTKDANRRKLRNAAVAKGVEKGFAAVSVAGVVQRAHVLAGTVDVHFKNKDDMLGQVYMEIKSEFHGAQIQGLNAGGTASSIRQMWFRMFDFVSEQPQDLLFLEFGNAAKILTPAQQAIVDGFAKDIADVLRRGVDDGTLVPLYTSLLSLLLNAPEMQLARSSALNGTGLDSSTIEQTFDRVWLSIAA